MTYESFDKNESHEGVIDLCINIRSAIQIEIKVLTGPDWWLYIKSNKNDRIATVSMSN